MMRILADENIQDITVRHLRELGHDVGSIKEEGLASISDDDVFAFAQEHGYTLLTYNTDLADLRELVGQDHHGIIRLRVSNQCVVVMHPILDSGIEQIQGMDLKNTLVTISDVRLRVRHTRSA